jgi:predicted phage terminase large subunit-like protein
LIQKKYERLLADYDKHCRIIEQASVIDINEIFSNKTKRITHLQRNYITWFEYYFPHYASCKSAPFHHKIAATIINKPVVKVLNDAFRGSAKSVHTMLGVPLYLALVKKELHFMLLVGQSEDKAKRLLSDIQAELEHNNRLINDYGRQFQMGNWADGNFTTKDGVHFHALGFGQDPRGLREGKWRPDYIGGDDIDTLKRCNNDRLIREAVNYITGTLWGCFDKGRERFVFNNNLIHKNSIMGKLIDLSVVANKEAKDNNLSQPYYHFKIPAILDGRFTPSWQEKYTSEYWREKRAATPYRSWMREYMCQPLVEGAIFNPEHIQYKSILPMHKYDALCLYGDLSYKDRGDYKAMVLVGKTGKEFHIIRAFVRQTSRAVCAAWLYDIYESLHLDRYNINYYIEGLFAQDEFISDFDAEGERRGYYIPVVADKKPKDNKYDRIESMCGYFERGNISFNIFQKNTADMSNLIDQLLAFEKGSGANDDAPDALQSAIAKLNQRTFCAKADIITTPREAFHGFRF